MPAIRTFGATPTTPIPFDAAATMPAVCVPWPLSSSAAAAPGTRGRGAFDPVVLDNIRAEVAAIGASDRDTDLAVAVDQRAASLRDTGRRVGGYRRAAIEHDVVLHRAGLGGDG